MMLAYVKLGMGLVDVWDDAENSRVGSSHVAFLCNR